MQYKLTIEENVVVGINDDGISWCIPNDPANRHWQEYQAWLALGNEPDPAE